MLNMLGAFGDAVEDLKELRERYGNRFRAVDLGLSLCLQSSDSKRHGYTMVACRIDLGTMKLLAARHAKPILRFFDHCTHLPNATCHGRDSVGFFDPQLAVVSHVDPIFRIGSERREE